MANPQKENGYTPISNEILEALARIRINGEARQILDVIIRKTYGFNKKQDAISLSQFVLATGLRKSTVCKGLSKLRQLNLITQKGNAIANIYTLNKDFDTWKPLPKKVILPKKVMTVTQKGKKCYPKRDIQKTVSKDTITKERELSKESLILTKYLHIKVMENFSFIKPITKDKLNKDVIEMDRLIRIDKRELEIIKEVIKWATQDQFWKQNIRSVKSLRKNFDTLLIQVKTKIDNKKYIEIT